MSIKDNSAAVIVSTFQKGTAIVKTYRHANLCWAPTKEIERLERVLYSSTNGRTDGVTRLYVLSREGPKDEGGQKAKHHSTMTSVLSNGAPTSEQMATNGNTDKPKGAKDLSESETKDTKETEAVEIDDDDDMIDEEQLEEYQEMVNQLGTFPVSEVL